MSQKLYYNITGQSLVWDAPEGRPSSVTSVTVYPASSGDDGTAESATTGSASVETNPNTTFDDAAAVLARTLPLAATTGIAIGRDYLITNATGEKEWVEVREITADVSVAVRNPIANAYASSDTFESTRVSISVDDTWIQDESNVSADMDPNPGYRVRWVYVVDSTTYVHDEYFDVVRYTGDHDVTGIDVDAVSHGWLSRLSTYHREDQGARAIDEAYSMLRFDLQMNGIDISMLRNRDVTRRLVIRRAIMAQQQSSVDAGRAEFAVALEESRREYDGLLAGLVTVVNRTAMDTDAEGGSTTPVAVSLLEK